METCTYTAAVALFGDEREIFRAWSRTRNLASTTEPDAAAVERHLEKEREAFADGAARILAAGLVSILAGEKEWVL